MHSPVCFWILTSLVGVVAAPSPCAPVVLRSGPMSLTIDAHSGGLAEVRWGQELLGRPARGIPPFDLRQDSRWIVGQAGTPLGQVEVKSSDARNATATVRAGDWQIAVRYALDPTWPMLTRSATITWLGKQPTKLKGFWLGSPAFAMGKGAYYYSPGVYPPNRFPAESLRTGATHGFHHSPAPLIVELAPRRTLLWLSDERTPDSDRPSVSVTEMDAAVRVAQGFSVLARMRPGDSQTVGSACLWLLETDGQEALQRIHDWMRRRGHVAPADRPEWFRDAVLYSFHPGGTIGSGFRDLGGFAAAAPLLDRIAALGANAIWVMPIEDAGVYHPRDYYKFQEGLGTPDEYRALVARAHQLGLHVLQDCVPHGGRNDYPRAKQHPEWLVYDEDGSTLSYWCFDFNWPTWRQYMAGVARHYVGQFGVDGYRVDAVGGSKIANWSPDIPYGRASFAQLQGGLNMLRSLRAAVKQLKPREGGLLAEVQGSVYGTESDAIYDFTGCYQAFQDVRRFPADEYVPRLRRWLHEQQYAETSDLLRLRHVESHDSLRGELWYGVEPVRAMMALSAWIHGMPLVYHEMENGHEAAFRRIFAIRRELVELRRGRADYLAVEAPPAVFACLRSDDQHASLVLINLASEPIDATAAVPLALLPPGLRVNPAVVALRPEGQAVLRGTESAQKLALSLRLRPFEYTVCALRPAGTPVAANLGDEKPALASQAPVSAASLQPTIDPRTGLLDRLCVDGQEWIGKVDLFVPSACRQQFSRATSETRGKEIVCRCPLGKSTLELRYAVESDGLHLRTRWDGNVPCDAAIYLPVVGARRWGVATAEGPLAGDYLVRHRPTESAASHIYWRAQGTNVIWDSLVHPLGPQMSQVLTASAARTLGIGFAGRTPPARVAWLDRLGTQEQLAAMVSWSDPRSPGSPRCSDLEIRLGDAAVSPRPTSWPGLRPAAGGWLFENEHYRLRLSRSGVIAQLVAKQPAPRTIVERADLYTDSGFHAERDRFGASNEVEAVSRIWDDAQGNLRMRFEGRLRGFQRFDLLKPPIEYFADYTLNPSASFRLSCGVRPHAQPIGKSAFLAQMIPVPNVRRAVFKAAGRTLHDGAVGDHGSRAWQSRSLPSPGAVDAVELRDDNGPLLQLTDLRCGAIPICNTFVHGQNFFLAWFDGPVPPGSPRQWRWTSTVCTPGSAVPQGIGEAPEISQAAEQSLLEDAGFERDLALRTVSLRSGEPLPGRDGESAWQPPPGARVVASPVHSGLAAAEVVSHSGQYLLWRQSLPIASLAPGTRLRLSAWVKGQAVLRGDAVWKVGVVRFAATTDRVAYASSPALTGTFDWRKTSVEMVVPPGLRELRVELGLNGATGSMWIDDVELQTIR
jgi:hypothetical protein